MTAHRVTHDGLLLHIHVIKGLDHFRQLLRDVVVHAVVLGPRLLRGVDVETSAAAEIERILIRHVGAARTRVRKHDANALFGGRAREMRFSARVFVGAREAGKVEEHGRRRRRAALQLRQEDAEGHFALTSLAPMTQLLQFSAFHFDVAFQRGTFGELERVVGDVDDGAETVAGMQGLDGVVDAI